MNLTVGFGETSDVTLFDAGVPGVDLFFCTVGGVPIEFMGGFAADEADPSAASPRRAE
ncbi:MAG: hypothetical protein WA944_16150 [Mycobacterium sp.]